MDADPQQQRQAALANQPDPATLAKPAADVAPTAAQQTATAQAGGATVRRLATPDAAAPATATPATATAATATSATATPAAALTTFPIGTVGRLAEPVKSPTPDANGKPHTLPAGTLVTVTGGVDGSPNRIIVAIQDAPGQTLQIDASAFKLEPDVIAPSPENQNVGQTGTAHYGKVHGDLWDPATGPNPADARHQGAAGDCYFISSMTAVCTQNPAQIEALFAEKPQPGADAHKTYKVSLYMPAADGSLQRKTVSVDRWLPEADAGNAQNWKPNDLYYDGSTAGGAPVTQAGAPETKKPHLYFWGELLEKAFAQLSGSYSAIGNGGWPALGMQALTGVASTDEQTAYNGGSLAPPPGMDAGTFILQKFKAFQDAGKAVVVSTTQQSEPPNPPTNPYGLFGPHAYQFMSVSGTNLILKNPWGVSDPLPIPASDFLNYFFDVATSSGNMAPKPKPATDDGAPAKVAAPEATPRAPTPTAALTSTKTS